MCQAQCFHPCPHPPTPGAQRCAVCGFHPALFLLCVRLSPFISDHKVPQLGVLLLLLLLVTASHPPPVPCTAPQGPLHPWAIQPRLLQEALGYSLEREPGGVDSASDPGPEPRVSSPSFVQVTSFHSPSNTCLQLCPSVARDGGNGIPKHGAVRRKRQGVQAEVVRPPPPGTPGTPRARPSLRLQVGDPTPPARRGAPAPGEPAPRAHAQRSLPLYIRATAPSAEGVSRTRATF